MAYSVSRQTGEMGLRVALGATPRDIFQMVVGRGLRLIAAGLCVGLICAFVLIEISVRRSLSSKPERPSNLRSSWCAPCSGGTGGVLHSRAASHGR